MNPLRRILGSQRPAILSRNRSQPLACLLSIALLIAQLGMQAHAYSHLAPEKHGVPTTLTCGHCLSVAPLLSAVGSSQHVWLAQRPASGHIAATEKTSIALLLPCPAFRSRAPPELL